MKIKRLRGGTAHKLPADMQKIILADTKMSAVWKSITPLARNEWICWAITAAKPETRARHLVVMRDKMHKGHRRPCCWAGCMHRKDKVASSVIRSMVFSSQKVGGK